jgi:tryptophan synthase alpha chain
MPYFTLGYPDRNKSLEIIEAIAPISHLLELGVPFSDPIADGLTIQHSTQVALSQGTTSASCLEMLGDLRKRGMKTPVLLMGYYNPILAYGEWNFVRDAALAGADGLIVPDLPPEEAGSLEQAVAEVDMALIYFLAPTSSPRRIRQVLNKANGFIYMVAVTGVTGARNDLRDDVGKFVNQVKSQTQVPVAVGFGISKPAQAAEAAEFADGIIIGSALINATDAAIEKPQAATTFLKTILSHLRRS